MAEEKLFQSALSRAMALCSKREYCIHDIRGKLHFRGLNKSDADKIIATLLKENFINEKRYAEAYVKDKFSYNKWGRVKIRAELKAKKIPGEIISDALECIDEKTYRETLKGLLQKHRKNTKAASEYEMRSKLLRYGLSKGFEGDLLYDLTGES